MQPATVSAAKAAKTVSAPAFSRRAPVVRPVAEDGGSTRPSMKAKDCWISFSNLSQPEKLPSMRRMLTSLILYSFSRG
jgi:hypothetical protein